MYCTHVATSRSPAWKSQFPTGCCWLTQPGNPDEGAGSMSAHPAASFSSAFSILMASMIFKAASFCPPHNRLHNPNPCSCEAGSKDGPRVWMTLIRVTAQSKKVLRKEPTSQAGAQTDRQTSGSPKHRLSHYWCQHETAVAHSTICLVVLNAFAFSKFCPSRRGNLRARGA